MSIKIAHNFKDLTNQIFGRWTVIKRDFSRLPSKKAFWICLCTCGSKGSVYSSKLISGKSKSCGCLSREQVSERFRGKSPISFIDLTGQVFERWSVIKRDLTKNNNKAFWICKCICGNIKSISGQSLCEGMSKSCGCLRQDLRKRKICKRGHDTSICGRNSNGTCKDCLIEIRRIDPTKDSRCIKEQFCPKGHDKNIVGKTDRGRCILCMYIYGKQYNKEHKLEIAIQHKKYLVKHPEIIRITRIKQETNRALRIVAWTDWDKIKEFYLLKPEGVTEDHIIPLQGNYISGLHVSWNLQWMAGPQNSSKYNKCNLLEASEWYGKILEEAGLK